MTVYGVSFDLVGKQPIVLLKTADGNTFLPIWIGHPEAAAILMNLQGTEPPRPMTHDLATRSSRSLDAEIRQVTVTELRDSTFYARITLVRNGTEIELDARTSDAIALALRADAKIFAADEVIEESGVEFEGDEEEASRRSIESQAESLADLDPDEFRRFLDTVTPDEFAAESEDERRGKLSRLATELVLRQGEQLASRARSSPAADSGPVARRPRDARAAAARGPGRRCRGRARDFSCPQPGDELEPAVDRRHDGLVVRRDLGADLLEALAHVSTAAASALR